MKIQHYKKGNASYIKLYICNFNKLVCWEDFVLSSEADSKVHMEKCARETRRKL